MSDTVVVVADDDAGDTDETVVVADDHSAQDAVQDAVTINLVDRMARNEEAHNTLVAIVAALSDKVDSLSFHQEMTDDTVQHVAAEVQEVAEQAADAIEDVVSDVDEASEEVTQDEVPTVRTHPFFRRWGS